MSAQLTDFVKKASSNGLNRQVGMYSLAAAMAGVSMLALAEPAAGEVVVTKKTIPIPMTPFGMREPVRISLANNGINDFGFLLSNQATSLISDRQLTVYGIGPRDGVLEMGYYAKALALPRGVKIGPSPAFFYAALVEGSQSFTSGRSLRGYWGGDPKDKYLGVSLQLNGETHYGWIRLTVATYPNAQQPLMSAKITAYAYETVANKPILAGTAEKATAEAQIPKNIQNDGGPSLGMLALGVDGLPVWRREETLNSR